MSKLFEALKRLELRSETEAPPFGGALSSKAAEEPSNNFKILWPVGLGILVLLGVVLVYSGQKRFHSWFKNYREGIKEVRLEVPVPRKPLPEGTLKTKGLTTGSLETGLQNKEKNKSSFRLEAKPPSSSEVRKTSATEKGPQNTPPKKREVLKRQKAFPPQRLKSPVVAKSKAQLAPQPEKKRPSVAKTPPSKKDSLDPLPASRLAPRKEVHPINLREAPSAPKAPFSVPENPFFSDRRWLLLAEEARQKGDYDRAAKLLERYKERHPEANVLNNLGGIYLLNGRYTQAINVLTQALKKKKDPDIVYNLALAYVKAGKHTQACLLVRSFPSPRLNTLAEALNCPTLRETRRGKGVSLPQDISSLKPR